MVAIAWLIPLFPLLAFAVTLALGRRAPGRGAGIGIAMLGLSLALSVGVLIETAGARGPERFFVREVPWFSLGNARISAGYLVDPLTSVMLIVVTVVGLMVQVYSIGYMHGDPRFPLFYAYLNLFTAAMLGLVLANNLVLLYACWEVMGLTSYLLIGFWFERPSAMRAAKKAFMVTRLGDVGFFFAILYLIAAAGTADLSQLVLGTSGADSPLLAGEGLGEGSGFALAAGPKLAAVGAAALGWIALLIFCGAIGKSAQFPLHVWLPDAMEGPTPVSALIHAATMVAAGVYLVARMFPVFTAAGPITLLGITAEPLQFVTWIGIITALLASFIAITQPDIKRILAYSTISQLGYMIFGLGIGAFTAATFHLMTHAFFKALLFLAAGSVIHGTGTQIIWEMGGLKQKMRTTFLTFLIGTLALAGIPPLAGFWSKDAILDHAFHQNRALWVLGLLGAFLTAFYMTRLLKVAFGGEWRGPKDDEVMRSGGEEVTGNARPGSPHHLITSSPHHPHESPPVMTGPLIVLAVLAVVAGWVGTPFADEYGHFVHLGTEPAAHPPLPQVLPLMGLSTLVALAGIGTGVFLYPNGQFRYRHLEKSPAAMRLYRLSYDKFYFDELYWTLLVVPFLRISQLAAAFDRRIIDGIVNGVGWLTVLLAAVYRVFDIYVIDFIVNLAGWIPKQTGRALRYLQTGQVQAYLFGLCFGAIVLFYLFLRLNS
jgi:NADH-quinone oxidoreductase subunit L